MPIYQCSAAAAITDAHVEATGAARVFVHVLTDANCAGVGAHHRRPEIKDRKGSGR